MCPVQLLFVLYRKRQPSMMTREDSLNIYRAWFTCDIRKLVASPYMAFPPFFKHGHKTLRFQTCLEEKGISLKNPTRDLACINDLRQHCLNSRFRVLKTIRTPLDWLYDLMKEFPTMKIIHLVRDPRAVANSLEGFDECAVVEDAYVYKKCLQYFCGRLEDDLTPFDLFSELFPGRMSRIFYEELALHPIKMAERIYNQLGMKISDRTRQYVYNITLAGNSPKHVLDTVRKDSRDGINLWMSELDPMNIKLVQHLCKYSMKKLSYRYLSLSAKLERTSFTA